MSAIATKKQHSKKEELKNFLLELLQEDFDFRMKVYQLLSDNISDKQTLPVRTKEEWQKLSKENSISWENIKNLQSHFKGTD
jgi:hypothetical protein